MVSTYTSNTGLEKPATGDQSGTWGDTVNVNMDIVDRVTSGVGAITLSGTTHTLTTTDGTLSEGMYRVLVLGGSPSGTNTITVSPNDQDKLFFVENNSGESVIFTQGSGANVTVADANNAIIYCDGAGAGAAVIDFSETLALTAPTANLPMAGFKHTGVGAGTALTEYADVKSVQNSTYTYAGTAGGTADALTLSPSPATTAYVLGQNFVFKSSASPNTGAATVAISGLAAKALEIDDAALVAGDIEANKYYSALYDGTAFQIEQISSPVIKSPDREIFTASGTFTKATLPAYVTHVTVEVWGAGGGGGAGNTSTPSRGYPGAGGGYSTERLAVSALGTTETVTIGAGGAGGASSGLAGATGGTSSFGAHLSATGGAGGIAGQAAAGSSAGAAPGVGAGGDLNLYGAGGAIILLQTTGTAMPGQAPGLGGLTGGLNVGTNGDKGAGGTGGNHSGGPAGGNGGAGLVIVSW